MTRQSGVFARKSACPYYRVVRDEISFFDHVIVMLMGFRKACEKTRNNSKLCQRYPASPLHMV